MTNHTHGPNCKFVGLAPAPTPRLAPEVSLATSEGEYERDVREDEDAPDWERWAEDYGGEA